MKEEPPSWCIHHVRNMKLNLKTYGFGVAALILIFGRYPVSWLLSSRDAKKPGPNNDQQNGIHIKSPTGNVLFVKSEGRIDAKPLVFIHGINASSEQWQYQQQYFNKNYRLILIDLPGHGLSTEVADLSVKALAIDLSAILTQLSIQQPVLYGHSLGGMMILEYCKLKLTPAPSAIVLQSCSYTNPLKTMPISPWPWLLQSALITPVLRNIARNSKVFTTLGYIAYSSGMSALFYRLLLFTGKQSTAILRNFITLAANTKAKTTAEALLHTFAFDAGNSLKNINVPCLIIAAEDDRLIDPKAGRHQHRQIEGSDLITVKGGHQSLAEFPEETNYALENFLRKNGI
ncbi:MAG TPA: alpha/beta hydrolase [Pedobacter sp.]